MGAVFNPPKPKAQPLPPEPPPVVDVADPSVGAARRLHRARAMAKMGRASNIKTGTQGLTSLAETTQKTLLGE